MGVVLNSFLTYICGISSKVKFKASLSNVWELAGRTNASQLYHKNFGSSEKLQQDEINPILERKNQSI